MDRKKSTPKKSRGKSRAELLTELSRDLARVMNNPACPSYLYNEIADCLCNMSSDIDYDTPEMIERSILAHVKKEEQRGGAQ